MAQNGNSKKYLVAEKVLIALTAHQMSEDASWPMDYGRDYNIAEVDKNFELEVRFWGDWEMPAGEIDDGDYDWKVPSMKTRNELDKICEKFSANGIKVGWCWGEKYWIYIGIK